MTATTAPTVDQVAPGLETRAREGVLDGPQRALTLGGLLLLAVAIVVTFLGGETGAQARYTYLVAYVFALTLALGGLCFVMIHHIARAGWSVVVRRVAENTTAFLWPWAPLLFLPLAVHYDEIWHHWAHANVTDPTVPTYDAVLAHKSGYLNGTFFMIRAAVYFVAWAVLARWFRETSIRQDATGDPELSLRMARRAAPGLLVFGLTITFASFDWLMSLDPHWYSTIFGVTIFAGAVMAFLALLAVVCLWLQRRGLLRGAVNAEHYHDIGKLMFAFMVFWTYVNFSQYMLIWYANIPEETLWFQHRQTSEFVAGVLLPWGWVGTVLVVGHFMVPFVFLMSRHTKRNTTTLAIASIFLLVMHWFDMQYLVMPTLHEAGMKLGWLDAVTMVGFVALFLGVTLRATAGAPLLPERDPRLAESLHFHNV